jgi:argonaute-like protein implicated in RNA metabolism and viral defense
VQDPYFIELDNERDREELEDELRHFMMGGKTFIHPKVVVCLLKYEDNYTMVKEVMHHFRLPSQVITTRNAFKFSLSKATNILRQINSKLGGDLYTLRFPEKMKSMRPMLIGIDVCHSGPQSIVGFSASINSDLSQYFSDYLVQPKG